MRIASLSCIATSLADTWASDLGQVHQSRVYDIITFRSVNPGYNGGISAIGTFYSLLGALLVGMLAK